MSNIDPKYQPHSLLQFFECGHLPDHLQVIVRPFQSTAAWVDQNLPTNSEKVTALRKLLEGKDCAVRAALQK